MNHVHSGKVRETFELDGGHLLQVATNRISAFDVVLGDLVPQKGAVLTAMTVFWIEAITKGIPHHLVAYGAGIDGYLPKGLWGDPELQKVALVVRKYKPVMIEAIGRHVLTGSGYADYIKTGMVCGIQLPSGLRDGDVIPAGPIFTPSTKADVGHDENITSQQAETIVGKDALDACGIFTTELLRRANALAGNSGITVADTKFEFGLDPRNNLVLIDEVLTPDSSRFMDEAHRQLALTEGRTPPSMDKQFVRDYLSAAGFKKMSPEDQAAFRLSEEVCNATTGIYLIAFLNLAGVGLEVYQEDHMGILIDT